MRPLLILDIDETIVYTTIPKYFPKNIIPDFQIKDWLCIKRPYLECFLKEMAIVYDLALYTAGPEFYAHFIKKHIFDKLNIPLIFVFSINECTFDGYKYLSHIIDKYKYPLNHIYVLEDNPEVYCFGNDIDRVIKIKNFKGDLKDIELLKIIRRF